MALLCSFVACALAANVWALVAGFSSILTPDPELSVRLVAVEGLGVVVDRPREVEAPRFELAVDVDGIPERPVYLGPLEVGGGAAMLRVSYRGVILAWGSVPRFTIDAGRLGRSAAGVATVVATAEGSLLREEMRNMIRAEREALGRVEFEVDVDFDAELPRSLGDHLRCKTYLYGGKPTEPLPPCQVRKKQKK